MLYSKGKLRSIRLASPSLLLTQKPIVNSTGKKYKAGRGKWDFWQVTCASDTLFTSLILCSTPWYSVHLTDTLFNTLILCSSGRYSDTLFIFGSKCNFAMTAVIDTLILCSFLENTVITDTLILCSFLILCSIPWNDGHRYSVPILCSRYSAPDTLFRILCSRVLCSGYSVPEYSVHDTLFLNTPFAILCS